MKTYNVIEYTEGPNAEHNELARHTVAAETAAAALAQQYPKWTGLYPTTTNGPDRAIIEGTHGYAKMAGTRYFIEAEPADPEDLTPKPQSPHYGALREAIARALVAEQLCEAAVAELARVAELPVDTAYTCMLSLSEWIPGDPITDEQCKAFVETPQEPAE